MTHLMHGFLKYWLPVVAWMSLIFSLSTSVGSATNTSRFIDPILHWLIPNISPGAAEKSHFVIRKAGHLSEYAVLGLLLWRALRQTRLGMSGKTSWKSAVAALVLSAAYAATDEFHQSFVPTRTPSPDRLPAQSGWMRWSRCWCRAIGGFRPIGLPWKLEEIWLLA